MACGLPANETSTLAFVILLVAELLGSLIGAIPDSPTWLRRLVVLVYLLVIAGCFVGLVLVVLSALS
jgi:hypothetical protein